MMKCTGGTYPSVYYVLPTLNRKFAKRIKCRHCGKEEVLA